MTQPTRCKWCNRPVIDGQEYCRRHRHPAEPAAAQPAEQFYKQNYRAKNYPVNDEQYQEFLRFAEAYAAHVTKGLRAQLYRLIVGIEPNGYPLWFNHAVVECPDCDSEDLCRNHHAMAARKWTGCEKEIDKFLASNELATLRASAEGAWVSVKERLPANGVSVICACKDGTVQGGNRAGSGGWFDLAVTHWQPLPAPPAEAQAVQTIDGDKQCTCSMQPIHPIKAHWNSATVQVAQAGEKETRE